MTKYRLPTSTNNQFQQREEMKFLVCQRANILFGNHNFTHTTHSTNFLQTVISPRSMMTCIYLYIWKKYLEEINKNNFSFFIFCRGTLRPLLSAGKGYTQAWTKLKRQRDNKRVCRHTLLQ